MSQEDEKFIIQHFTYHKGSLLSMWKTTLRGDCQDFAWTMLRAKEETFFKCLVALVTRKAAIRRCKSPVNKWYWPRHAILRYEDKWIESTDRKWSDDPSPNKPLWPALPLPITIAIIGGVNYYTFFL